MNAYEPPKHGARFLCIVLTAANGTRDGKGASAHQARLALYVAWLRLSLALAVRWLLAYNNPIADQRMYSQISPHHRLLRHHGAPPLAARAEVRRRRALGQDSALSLATWE